MKVLSVGALAIPDVKIVKYQRFLDERCYFTETYRKSDFAANPQTSFLKDLDFNQVNESYSKKGTIRGLHFQWNPYMAKFVRLIKGSMIDLALDIRLASPTFGKIVGYELNSRDDQDFGEWIYVPVGFAHGVVFQEEGMMEYFCTGQWAPETERGISPLSQDIDWSLVDPALKGKIDEVIMSTSLLSEKDRNGLTLSDWSKSEEAKLFTYSS